MCEYLMSTKNCSYFIIAENIYKSISTRHLHAFYLEKVTMFAKAPSLRIEAPEVASERIARSDILMMYDRWNRTDSGGYVKNIKAALGIFEEMEIIENFEAFFGLRHNSLLIDNRIRDTCTRVLRNRLDAYFAEAEKALKTLQTTLRHTESLGSKQSVGSVSEQYISRMVIGMKNLLELREKSLSRLKKVESFSKEFEEIQFLLLLVSETAQDYIPRLASSDLPLVPRTLEEVREHLFL